MIFQTFLEEVKTLTEKKLPKSITIHFRKVQKNNGVVFTGIYLDNCEKIIASPLIYMEPFFAAYQSGTAMETIAGTLKDILLKPMPKDILRNIEEGHRFLLDDVVVRLVCGCDNEAYLKNIAHTDYLDMAATFGVMVRPDETTDGTIQVTPEIMKDFQMDEEDLFRHALKNTERMLGEELFDLEHYLESLSLKCGEEAEDIVVQADANSPINAEIPVAENRVYVLTNRMNRYGAAAMLYSRKMRVLSEVLKMDLYILPCSVHEVILIPKRDECKDELKRMVLAVNANDVPPEEVLTNSVYEYSRETGLISVVA